MSGSHNTATASSRGGTPPRGRPGGPGGDDADGKGVPAPPVTLPKTVPFRQGQPVDAQDRLGTWYEGTVCDASTSPVPAVLVHFTYWSSAHDEWISVDPSAPQRVFKAGESGRVFRPGVPPRPGMLVDAWDDYPTMRKFIPATIIEVDAADNVLVHYRGFVSKFDKWLPATSGLVRPHGSITRKRYPFRVKIRAGTVPPEAGAANAGAAGASGAAARDGAGVTVRQPQHQPALQSGTSDFDRFEAGLARAGLRVAPQEGDGNCLFRSIAHQVYGVPELHARCRQAAVDYLAANSEWLRGFVEDGDEGVAAYLRAMARNAVWGGEPELVAFHELYRRPIEVWSGAPGEEGARVIMRYAGAALPGMEPVRLSYYGGGHYDSIVGVRSAGALLDPDSVGRTEEAAIAAARAGAAGIVARTMGAGGIGTGSAGAGAAGSSSSSSSAAAAGASTDGDAALVAALQASRQSFEEGLMLDQALALSMGGAESAAAAPADGSAGGAGAGSGVAAPAGGTEAEMLMRIQAATAAEAEERSLQEALERSRAAAQSQDDEDALMAAALAASVGGGDSSSAAGPAVPSDDDAIMAAALAESAALASHQEDDHAALAAALAASVGEGAAPAADSDEVLQEAIRRSQLSSAVGHGNAADALEEEDLQAALQASSQDMRAGGAAGPLARSSSAGSAAAFGVGHSHQHQPTDEDLAVQIAMAISSAGQGAGQPDADEGDTDMD